MLPSECLDFVENDQLYLRKFSKAVMGARKGRYLRCCPPPYCKFEATSLQLRSDSTDESVRACKRFLVYWIELTTATGLLVKAVRAVAASYTTVLVPASSKSKISLKYRASTYFI
jgi:hypothetical protein